MRWRRASGSHMICIRVVGEGVIAGPVRCVGFGPVLCANLPGLIPDGVWFLCCICRVAI